ncbi:MAG: sulfurtransferase-like selenium metabolism protein YedF [Candidatus Delongbacteria bacterium]|nr:sulfurtransferase-like selenium metabolism protein YedF [Candidatus Delongbacteria bacterium]MBN2833982.1 sulfurtransferase-like selenium metabolism protein YedF [Candidatus Delongbacteria bacterium]
MKKIDLRNLACPGPVIETKKAIAETNEDLIVVINSVASRENVGRFLQSQNIDHVVIEKGVEFEVHIKSKSEKAEVQSEENASTGRVVYITDDKIGEDSELGKILMKAFIHTIKDADILPEKIFFVNKGVFITTNWEDSINDLKEFEKLGVKIYSCGTCLNFFNITENLKVGMIGNAYDTVNSLLNATSVVRF